jgi:hypothetical protein
MAWPLDLIPERYPGTVRRELTVEAKPVDGRLVFTAVLRDRWYDDAGHEEEIHGYEVRLVTEPPDLTVVAVEVQPHHLPFPECPAAAQAARGLVGLRLTKGFRAGAVEALGGVEGCTHLLTLVLAASNHQVATQYLLARVDDGSHPVGTPDFEQIADTCAGWREGGTALRLVRERQPFPPHRDYSEEPFRAP